jgi:hypothetical protein
MSTTRSSINANKSQSKKTRVMVDGVSVVHKKVSPHPRTASPITGVSKKLTFLLLRHFQTTTLPSTIVHNQFQQHPHAQIYNYYAHNPFGHLFHPHPLFGQPNVHVQPQQNSHYYTGQYNQQIPQQFYQQSQAYYSTNQPTRRYPVRTIADPIPTTPPSKVGQTTFGFIRLRNANLLL